jgi:hypothetical protein
MKVVCIQNSDRMSGHIQVVKGNIYHIIEEEYFGNIKFMINGNPYVLENGIYYRLIETGEIFYHSSLFIEINETEIDELELVNNLKEIV